MNEAEPEAPTGIPPAREHPSEQLTEDVGDILSRVLGADLVGFVGEVLEDLPARPPAGEGNGEN